MVMQSEDAETSKRWPLASGTYHEQIWRRLNNNNSLCYSPVGQDCVSGRIDGPVPNICVRCRCCQFWRNTSATTVDCVGGY